MADGYWRDFVDLRSRRIAVRSRTGRLGVLHGIADEAWGHGCADATDREDQQRRWCGDDAHCGRDHACGRNWHDSPKAFGTEISQGLGLFSHPGGALRL